MGYRRGGRGHGHGPGRFGGWTQADVPSATDAAGWFAGRLPDNWFEGAPTVTVDRDEIIVVGRLPDLPHDATATDATNDTDTNIDAEEANVAARAAAEAGRIARFREDTREERMAIAREAEHRYARKVAWGAQLGGTHMAFTTISVPVMTRLRQPERQVLDTLVDAGVARSRSEALAWCVRLVGEHADTWLQELRDAMVEVDRLRSQGPTV